MNLPNKLTIFRMCLIPFFLIFLLVDAIPLDMQIRRYISAFIFIFASLTDALDGYIARKHNLITDFGKFMDPLADKVLVVSAMIALIGLKDAVVPLPPIIVIIIIAREFLITGFRTLASSKNIVIAAGNSGKIKTVFQMLMVIFLLVNINNILFVAISYILMYGSVIFTIYSALEYMLKNKETLKQ